MLSPLSLILSLWHLFAFFWAGIVLNFVRYARDAVFPPTRTLKGEVVLVTNATSQIGRDVVLRLLLEGCDVVIWGIQQEAMDHTIATVRKRLSEKNGAPFTDEAWKRFKSDRISTFVVDDSSRDAIYSAAEATKQKASPCVPATRPAR